MAEKHLNITELSEITGISRNTISNIYNEKTTRIDLKTVTVLCSYFKCTPNDLIVIDESIEAFKSIERR